MIWCSGHRCLSLEKNPERGTLEDSYRKFSRHDQKGPFTKWQKELIIGVRLPCMVHESFLGST
jgi:hypothetical protein